MKKILSIAINIILFSFFTTSAIATANICEDFYEALRSQGKELELGEPPLMEESKDRFGFTFFQKYSDEKEDWIYERNKNNNIVIFYIEEASPVENVLLPNDIIISINDKLVSDLSDNEINDALDHVSEITFEALRDENDKILKVTERIKKDKMPPRVEVTPEFNIISFNDLNIKDSQYTINYQLSYWWEDNRLTEVFRKIFEKERGTIEENIDKTQNEWRKDGYEWQEDEWATGYYCSVKEEEFLSEKTYTWLPEIEFINSTKDDLQNKTKEIYFNYDVYVDGTDGFWIEVRENGIATFNSSFNFQAFPFDMQTLEFIYAENSESRRYVRIDYNHYTNPTIDKKLTGPLVEWSIPENGSKIEYYEHIDPYNYVYDGIKNSIIISRNSEYYLFKVLAPIVLILMICWSIFWLHLSQIESRLTVSIVCLLALIAYNFVIDDSIPKLAYLTIMDVLILSSYLFASIPTVVSIFSYRKYVDEGLDFTTLDKYLRFIGPILYLITIYFIMLYNIHGNINVLPSMKGFFGG